MNENREEPPEGNNPSQATPQPHPHFIIRHDEVVQQNSNEETPEKQEREQPKSDAR